MPFVTKVNCATCGKPFRVDAYNDKRTIKRCAACSPINEQMLDLDYRSEHKIDTYPIRNKQN